MPYDRFENISSDDLEKMMRKERESDYLVVDVRTVQEYGVRHIPGAMLMPLHELEANLFDLPSDRKLVFYCHSGGRSMAAATLVAEAEICEKGIHNLEGGMLAWRGHALSDFPRIEVFKDTENLAEILTVAIDLEKGASRFYRHVQEKYPEIEILETVTHLAKAEVGHAKAVHGLLRQIDPLTDDFETLYENMHGDILEGGAELETQLEKLAESVSSPCMRFIEIALEIECAAYDLYRAIAEKSADESARESLLKIAQMEKAHMRQLAKATKNCGA
jgi:rhodanese-related sulfurtransferase/rubrerythrin